MSEQEIPGDAEGHGVHGTERGDTGMEEEPAEPTDVDSEKWADKTETGGEAAS